MRVKDFFTGKQITISLSNKNYIEIVTGEDKEKNFIIQFTKELDKLETLPMGFEENTGNFYNFDSEETLKKMKFKESINDGNFYKKLSLAPRNQNHYRSYEGIKEKIPDYVQHFENKKPFKKRSFADKLENIKNGTDSISNLLTEGKPYTFGIEMETSAGFVPTRILIKYNVRVTYDGSIQSGEYITGILWGDAGFTQLYNLCSELNKRCSVNNRCGLHVHIGDGLKNNFDQKTIQPILFNKEFTVYAYMFGLKIQEELYKYLPPSRANNTYCRSLPEKNFGWLESSRKNKKEYQEKLEYYYTEIFQSLLDSNNFLGPECNKSLRHPGGRYVTGRYSWINFIGFNFQRSNITDFTCEFRNHGGTTNYLKIQNWILFCMAMVYFIENNKQDILLKKTITVKDVIYFAYSKNKADSLWEYFQKRKEKFISVGNDSDEYQTDKNKKLFIKKTTKELL